MPDSKRTKKDMDQKGRWTVRTQRRAPIAPERAIRYLIQCEYTDADKLIESARYLSNNLYSHLATSAIDQFLQAIYDEKYHFA